MKQAVMIGAGQIGRGFIGMLLEKAGYHVVFADVNMDVVNDINTRGEYTVHLMDTVCEETVVKNISAMHVASPELVEAIAQPECDLICTSVGLTALTKVAPVIASGLTLRRRNGVEEPMNIIACENAIRGTSQLKAMVEEHLDEEDLAWLPAHTGFPDSAVDRIIPPRHDVSAAESYVERYHEWDVERGGFIGEIPEVEGMEVVDDLTAYLERKLFTLNGPNAVTACMGYERNYPTINETLKDPEVYAVVWGMMEECCAMLVKRHGFSPESLEQYRKNLMQRFMNPYIIDDCVRVAREPIRKLSPQDRIIAPMMHAHEYGIPTPSYYTGVASVLLYANPEEPQCMEIQKMLSEGGVRRVMEQVCDVHEDDIIDAIEKEYERLKG